MHEVEEEGGLLHRVGAVGDDDPEAVVVDQGSGDRLVQEPQIGEGQQIAPRPQQIGRPHLDVAADPPASRAALSVAVAPERPPTDRDEIVPPVPRSRT